MVQHTLNWCPAPDPDIIHFDLDDLCCLLIFGHFDSLCPLTVSLDTPLPMDPILPPLQPPSSFPAVTKQAAGYVDGVPTDVMSMFFADKIMVTVTQGGRLAQWV